MQGAELKPIFEKISKLHVGVIGDLAVDFYFDLQKNTGELSLETTREVWWGTRPRTSLGAAGNVVQNLAALGVGNISTFGVAGADLFGRELVFLLREIKVDTSGIVCPKIGWDTCAYSKPMQQEEEQNRLDFGNYNQLDSEDFLKILAKLEVQLPRLDVLIVNQQFENPLITEARVKLLNELTGRYPHVCLIADMRAFGLSLRGTTLKVNTPELARLLGLEGSEFWTNGDCATYGKQLAETIQGPVLITRAEHGMLYTDGREVYQRPAVSLSGPLDPVGAGDAAVAAFAGCVGAKIAIPTALDLANLAAAVTVQKLQQTGTANPEEIAKLAANA